MIHLSQYTYSSNQHSSTNCVLTLYILFSLTYFNKPAHFYNFSFILFFFKLTKKRINRTYYVYLLVFFTFLPSAFFLLLFSLSLSLSLTKPPFLPANPPPLPPPSTPHLPVHTTPQLAAQLSELGRLQRLVWRR